MEPFEVVTREVYREKYVTCGKIIRTVYNLLDNLSHIDCQSEFAKTLKLNLMTSMNKRFKAVESNQIPATAMVLDPRFKTSYFKSALAASTALTHLNKKLKLLQPNNERQEINDVRQDGSIEVTGIWKHHEKRIAKSRKSVEQNDIGYHFELKQYLKEPEITYTENPLR